MSSRRFVAKQSQSFQDRERNRTVFFWCTIVVVLVSWTFIFSRLSKLSVFAIDVVEVNGADPEIIPLVRAAALESIDGNYLHLFSRSNIFIYPRNLILKTVKAASPRILEVGVKHNKLNGIVVSVKEKRAVAVVCNAFPDFVEGRLNLQNDERCMLADDKGFLYQAASSTEALAYHRYYIPSLSQFATSSALHGVFATSTQEFTALQDFYDALEKHAFDVKAILFKDKGEYEAYVSVATSSSKLKTGADSGQTSVIYFNTARPLSVQLDNLILFWNHALEGASGHALPSYEYIDVRYGPNVFFRERK